MTPPGHRTVFVQDDPLGVNSSLPVIESHQNNKRKQVQVTRMTPQKDQIQNGQSLPPDACTPPEASTSPTSQRPRHSFSPSSMVRRASLVRIIPNLRSTLLTIIIESLTLFSTNPQNVVIRITTLLRVSILVKITIKEEPNLNQREP